MTFGEKLKAARKAADMSQEALAEKLRVSRQAVTKWETGRGNPDIENMIVISNLFGISVDEFLSEEKSTAVCKRHLYESKTEYDIDGRKRFDLKLGGAAQLKIRGTDGEKIVVRLSSDNIESVEKDFKVKIDDIKGRIDVEVKRCGITEAEAKRNLFIDLELPNMYLSHTEFEINSDEIFLNDLSCGQIEFKGRANSINIDDVCAELEIDCNIDLLIEIQGFCGKLGINQVSATSRLRVPYDFSFRSVLKGLSTALSYEIDGEAAEDFSDSAAEHTIEFNGVKSELVIFKER